MKTKKKLSALVLIFILSFVAFTGCASQGGWDDEPAPYDYEASVQVPTLESGTENITGYVPILAPFPDEFQQNPLRVVEIYADNHGGMLALMADGSLYSWGWGLNPLVGSGIPISYHMPTKVMDNVAEVHMFLAEVYVLTKDGMLYGWGRNAVGQLGIGTIDDFIRNPELIMDNVKSFIFDGTTSYIIQNDGSLWGWGDNSFSQLGDGITETRILSPVWIMDDVVDFSNYGRILRVDGSLWFRGNTVEEIINDTILLDDIVEVFHRPDGGQYIIRNDRSLWGLDVGNDSVPQWIMDDVANVAIREWFVRDGAIGVTVYAIKTDGSLWGWGDNTLNQLGDGTWENMHSPILIMSNVAEVHLAYFRYSVLCVVYAIDMEGSLWSWGFTQLGILSHFAGEHDSSVSPTKRLENVDTLTFSSRFGTEDYNNVFTITADGSLWGWGTNESGQLGIGDYSLEFSYNPVLIIDSTMPPGYIAWREMQLHEIAAEEERSRLVQEAEEEQIRLERDAEDERQQQELARQQQEQEMAELQRRAAESIEMAQRYIVGGRWEHNDNASMWMRFTEDGATESPDPLLGGLVVIGSYFFEGNYLVIRGPVILGAFMEERYMVIMSNSNEMALLPADATDIISVQDDIIFLVRR